MDEIRIQGLKVFAHHGVFPGETLQGQNFIVNAVLYVSNGNVGETDDLAEVTNYAEVVQEIVDEMQQNTCKLIEAAAEHVAYRILKSFALCYAVDIEIGKPEAPIPAQFDMVSVKIHRSRHHVYIGIGSNMGERDQILKEAIDKLELNDHFSNLKCSEIITTKAYGLTNQPDFRNGVISLDTLYSPEALLLYLHELEKEAGRVRKEHWGPRTLDLDILFYDDMILDSEQLVIPHPDLHNRDFVLGPMKELAPHFVHPILKCTMEELEAKLPDR